MIDESTEKRPRPAPQQDRIDIPRLGAVLTHRVAARAGPKSPNQRLLTNQTSCTETLSQEVPGYPDRITLSVSWLSGMVIVTA